MKIIPVIILVLIVSISTALQAPAQTVSIMAIPATAEVNQVVTLVAPVSVSPDIWSLSGGEWCLYRDCFWRSDDDLIAGTGAGDNPLWRATAAGSYTITLTTPEGTSSSVTITVN